MSIWFSELHVTMSRMQTFCFRVLIQPNFLSDDIQKTVTFLFQLNSLLNSYIMCGKDEVFKCTIDVEIFFRNKKEAKKRPYVFF